MKTEKVIPQKNFCLVLLLLLSGFYVRSQNVPSKIPTPEDYPRWTMLHNHSMDVSGKWMLYKISGALTDTIVLQSTGSALKYTFPNADEAGFVSASHFVVHANQTLHVVDLKKKAVRSVSGIDHYSLAGDKFILTSNKDDHKAVDVRDLQGTILYQCKNVVTYFSHPRSTSVAVVKEKEGSFNLVLLEHQGGHLTERNIMIAAGNISNCTWSEDGTQLAFLEETQQGKVLHHYNTSTHEEKTMQRSDRPLSDFDILPHLPLAFSADGQTLFFKARYKAALPKNNDNVVQVWNAADKWIYPSEQMVMGFTRSLHLMLWNLAADRYQAITDTVLPNAIVTANAKWAILHNPKTYEPQFKEYPDLDFYSLNLVTGIQKKFLNAQPGTETALYPTPDGENLVYFRSGTWYSYNLENDVHLVLTNKVDRSDYEKNNFVSTLQSVGCSGWSKEGTSVLLYDAFDLWEVALDGSESKRWTRGREIGMVYRILAPEKNYEGTAYGLPQLPIFDTGKEVLTEGKAVDFIKNGLYFWDKDAHRKTLYEDRKKIYDILIKENTIAWTSESYAVPPHILVSSAKNHPKIRATSNKQEAEFAPRKLEVITYKSSTGKQLKGLLYFPYNFRKDKKYPLITHIYEIRSREIHNHLIPSNSTAEDGFNTQHYLAKGYFVLLPDIAYEWDQVGKSATICVENAVASALRKAPIDEKKIGLMGHSFGGYQTSLIITRSTIFACAIAGAGASDLVSGSLAVYRNRKRPNMYRVEKSQPRISQSVTEDRKNYIENSPIYFVKKIQTPLLTWTGLEDTQVEATQSMELYMAMRREGKTHILLNYPNESHGFTDQGAIADLINKVDSWFDHYLKNVDKERWMVPKN